MNKNRHYKTKTSWGLNVLAFFCFLRSHNPGCHFLCHFIKLCPIVSLVLSLTKLSLWLYHRYLCVYRTSNVYVSFFQVGYIYLTIVGYICLSNIYINTRLKDRSLCIGRKKRQANNVVTPFTNYCDSMKLLRFYDSAIVSPLKRRLYFFVSPL